MKQWLLVVVALAVLLAAQPAEAGKFKNKDTAEDRQDTIFGTRPKNLRINNQGGPGNDTVISVHPEDRMEKDKDMEIGPILIQPKIDY